ncbi:MAG: YtxH domain-containing protein [Armatimonadetes bacterium]|nr:YtxH domain-containing protein [Armatimonadota bacterium]
MAERGDFLAGLFVGAAFGIGLGMLLAPQAGKETQDKLRHKAEEMSQRMRGAVEKGCEAVQEARNEHLNRLEEI